MLSQQGGDHGCQLIVLDLEPRPQGDPAPIEVGRLEGGVEVHRLRGRYRRVVVGPAQVFVEAPVGAPLGVPVPDHRAGERLPPLLGPHEDFTGRLQCPYPILRRLAPSPLGVPLEAFGELVDLSRHGLPVGLQV